MPGCDLWKAGGALMGMEGAPAGGLQPSGLMACKPCRYVFPRALAQTLLFALFFASVMEVHGVFQPTCRKRWPFVQKRRAELCIKNLRSS